MCMLVWELHKSWKLFVWSLICYIFVDMQVSEIQLFQMLREKIGEKEAQSLVEFVETKIEKEFDSKKDTLATKEDLANMRSDVIKWMFIFWVGQLAAMIAIVKLFHV